jgi:hypothetical protein
MQTVRLILATSWSNGTVISDVLSYPWKTDPWQSFAEHIDYERQSRSAFAHAKISVLAGGYSNHL